MYKGKNKSVVSISKRKKISLEKRFKKYKGKNMAKKFKWDSKIGKEIW